PDGHNRFTMRQLLAPLEQTANLCRMHFLPPFAVQGTLSMSSDADVAPHGEAYRTLLEALRDDRQDLEAAARADMCDFESVASLLREPELEAVQ
ncbi:MAG: NAD(P)H-dependent oxidoreductase, partial [Myxococcota bacterium]